MLLEIKLLGRRLGAAEGGEALRKAGAEGGWVLPQLGAGLVHLCVRIA